MRRWIPAPLLASLVLLTQPCFAAKPVPPPPPPTIVAQIDGYAFASDGTVYEYNVTDTGTCGVSLSSVVVFARFFTTPQASPVTTVVNRPGGDLVATLANGDVWILNRNNFLSCYLTGKYVGNIFTMAGTALGTVAPQNLAPVRSAPEDGASAAHGPRSVPPVPGAVE